MRPRARFRLSRNEVRAEASGGASAHDPVPEIQRVAREHAPEGGEGWTSWNHGTRTVFWSCGDWTGDDEIQAAKKAFLAIDGVERFTWDMEARVSPDDGWQQVWPEAGSEEAYERVLALAQSPLRL